MRRTPLNVVAGKIDINEIRVLANTRWYPGWLYAARAGLQPDIVKSIKNALLKLDHNRPEYKRILDAADIASIIPSEDKDFDPVRELAARIGIGLEEFGGSSR